MPVGIDAQAERLVGLGVVGSHGTIVLAQQCGTVRATDMQAHVLGVATVEAVAVDTALELGVLNQRTLIERGQVAFVNAHLAPYLVAGLNQTVADTVVDAVSTDVDGERAIGMPAVVILGRNDDAEGIPAVLTEQCMPVVDVEVDRFLALTVQTVPMAIGNDGIDTQCCLICHVETERCYIHGYSDTEVVGIDPGLFCLLPGIADGLVTGGQHPAPDTYYEIQNLSHRLIVDMNLL